MFSHQNSTDHLRNPQSATQYVGHTSGTGLGTHLTNNIPANPYLPSHRARANTINQMDAAVPPALARLQHMNQDVIGRNALTPVLNRDDAMREWERRQQGKPAAAQPYPQLEYLQQQAELAAASGLATWGGSHPRYPPPPSKLSHSYQPTMIVEDESGTRRDPVISSMRTAANVLPTSTQTYANNSTAATNRYPANYNQNQQAPAFDTVERRTDMGNMYVPMQPDPYQSYNAGPPSSTVRHVNAVTQPATSFYGPSAVPTGQINPSQARNQYLGEGMQTAGQGSKDVRRNVDTWTR